MPDLILSLKLQIGCFCFTLLTAIPFFAIKRAADFVHKLFRYLIIVQLISLSFDMITVYTVNNLVSVPPLLNKTFHIIFISSLCLFIYLTFLYIMRLVTEDEDNSRIFVYGVPFFISVIAVVFAPLAFIETERGNYSSGPGTTVVYHIVGFYLVMMVYLIICHWKKIDGDKRRVILIALLTEICVSIAQLIQPTLLISSLGTTLITLAIYLTIENPDRILRELYFEEKLRADAANNAKSAFLANMSHEIRTPMNSIMGFAELAADNEVPPKVREYLEKIIGGTKWLLHIINDILDISKIESGKMELESIPFDLQGILLQCQSVIHPVALEKGLELRLDAELPDGGRFMGDPVKLHQALINLLSNAVKFTDHGEVKLSSKIISSRENSAIVYFEVADNGIGMTSGQINRIFEPFMQADSGTTRNYGGTGLGLPIAKNLVEMMGGALRVKSSPGSGSVFNFEITFEKAETPEFEDEPGSGKTGTIDKPDFKGTVLICEDNTMNQQVISEHLTRLGLDAVIAENGKIGYEMVKTRLESGGAPYDLIFMDVYMPVMDGMEAASKINGLGAKIPIVAMTANVMAGELEKYRKSGMVDHIGKPFTSQELWRCLLKYLSPVGFTNAGKTGQTREDNILAEKLRRRFLTDNLNKSVEISEAITSGDLPLAHRLAHTLKGNAGQIGKHGLQDTAAKLETILGNGEIPAANLITELGEKLDAVIKELRAHEENRADMARHTAPDKYEADEMFRKLDLMLKDINPECADYLDEIRLLPGTEDLARQIENYDFDAAAVTLAGLRNRRDNS